MRIVVTGIGPRSGTSAMMKRLINKGYSFIGSKFPAHGVNYLNPDGYYELELDDYDESFSLRSGQCIKLWPGRTNLVEEKEVDLFIIMRRMNRDNQIASVVKTGIAEGMDMTYEKANYLINECEKLILPLLHKVPHVIVHTEDPDKVEAYL